jgi:plastocyanin
MPEDLTIAVGDTVRFKMSSSHNAIEVSQSTYESGATKPLEGGFQVDYGETLDVIFEQAGTHYYVCQPHVTLDMIGTITVE